jgi:hypothetical protein
VSVQLGTARSEVRALLDEPNPQFWSNAQINSWLNQAAQDIARQAQALWMQVSIPAVALQQTYTLPTDFLGVHRLDFNLASSIQTYNLEFRGIKAMDEVWGILQQLPAAFPQAFYLWNNTDSPNTGYFGTYPVVGGSGTFILYYYRNAVPATSDSALLDITPAYEDIAYEYCIFKAKRADRDPTWQDALQVYNTQLQNMMDRTSRFSDQGDQFVSAATSNWPVYMYGDSTSW